MLFCRLKHNIPSKPLGPVPARTPNTIPIFRPPSSPTEACPIGKAGGDKRGGGAEVAVEEWLVAAAEGAAAGGWLGGGESGGRGDG